MKFSKTQQDLLEAMSRGVVVYWMPYRGPHTGAYYFREDTMRSCTPTALALLHRELVERYAIKWNGHKLRVKAPPQLAKEES